MKEIDASILQFIPKGGFYNTENEQLRVIQELWQDFFENDRLLFALSSILPGTAYSKGRMAHVLLSNPLTKDDQAKALVPKELLLDNFETKTVMFNLSRETTTRSLKNLLMLTGAKDQKGKPYLKRVNNARTRKIILSYLFDRSQKSLEDLAVKYKSKVRRLVQHALGKQNVYKLLLGDDKTFRRFFGEKNKKAYPILLHLFNQQYDNKGYHYPKVEAYYELREAARKKDLLKFRGVVLKELIPYEVVVGFRNTYKLDVSLKNLLEKAVMSDKQKLQMESAARTEGVELEINYQKYDLYDLWKIFYFKVFNKDYENIQLVVDALKLKSKEKMGFNFGDTVVIFDCSESMKGSEKRPLHPFLTGLAAISTLQDVTHVEYVGGKHIEVKGSDWNKVITPSGSTNLWRALIRAVLRNPETIVVISDGYENVVKGLFEEVYYHFRKLDFNFKLFHFNPVFASEVGGARKLAEDVKPMILSDYKFLETNCMFQMLQSDREQVKQFLVSRYQTLITQKAEG